MIDSLCLELWTSQAGWTALILAAGNSHRDVAGLLLDHGANIEAKNDVSRSQQPFPTGQGEPLASDGLNATWPVHARGMTQWRLEVGRCNGGWRSGMERELWSIVGVGRVGMCCRLGGRGGQVLDPSLQARGM